MIEQKNLIILHDLDGRPYYKALQSLPFGDIKFVESSIFKIFIRDIIKRNFKGILRRFFKNFKFRLFLPFIRNNVIIIGMAPNDFRILYYSILTKKNTVIFHTSHPYWNKPERTVRSYGHFLDFYLRKKWNEFLKSKSIKVVCVSHTSYMSLDGLVDKENLFQITHCVDQKIFYPKKMPRKDRTIHVAFIGKLILSKGILNLQYLIEKLKDDNSFHFHIIGDGEGKRIIEGVLNYSNVTYYGWVKDELYKAKILRSCDVLINPSIKTDKWEELFGIVNIEGMMSGLVIIASNHVGPREIIHKDFGFLIEESDQRGFLDTLIFLKNNPDKLILMQKNSALHSQKFSLSEVSKKWAGLL